MEVEVTISPDDFPDLFDGWGDDQFPRTWRDSLRSAVSRSMEMALGQNCLKLKLSDQFAVSCVGNAWEHSLTLANIYKTGGFTATGFKLEVDVPKHVGIEDLLFRCGRNLRFHHWLPDETDAPTVKIKSMKKWDRLDVRFHRITVSSAAVPYDFTQIASCKCDSSTLKPVSGQLLQFECFVCGKRYLCECFRGIAEGQARRESFHTAPYDELLKTVPYKKNACHLCQGVPSTTGAHGGRGGNIHAYYWRYISAFAMRNGFDYRAAENEVRDRLGVPRIGEGWLSEVSLLRMVQALLPDHEVVHQASPDWLGRQRLDIFVPALNLAIEYNGEQHYFPIARFGGEAGLLATQLRDAEKRRKARNAGVELIEFRYDEVISPELVQKRIRAVTTNRR